MQEEVLYVVDKEKIIGLNQELIRLIRAGDNQGRNIVSLAKQYPTGYTIPKLLQAEVKRYIVEHNEYLLNYGNIGDVDRTEVSILKKILP